jgi:phenylacetyl-CoA:acceptor oxidoreductase
VAERVAEFPFTVAFAYTMDETNHMADVLLPEASDLESLQLIRIGGTKFQENFWEHQGWAIRQPAVENVVDCMDMTEIFTKLAERVGILEGYNEAINNGAAGQKLRVENVDYSLDPDIPHDREEIWDRICKAASHKLSGGADVHDLEWFKEHGYMLADFPKIEWYLYPRVKDQGLRFELPYQERILRHGTQLANRLHESGIEWWDKQLDEYEPMPSYQRFPDIWIEYAREVGRDPDEFPMWALTTRSTQYSWGANVGIPVIKEVADNIAGHKGVIINRGRAAELGLADGDPVVIESATGTTRGNAVLREGIRPDTVVMVGQFDHWKTPIAKDFNLPSLNSVTALALSLTDSTGSSADIARVKIYRDESPRQAAE